MDVPLKNTAEIPIHPLFLINVTYICFHYFNPNKLEGSFFGKEKVHWKQFQIMWFKVQYLLSAYPVGCDSSHRVSEEQNKTWAKLEIKQSTLSQAPCLFPTGHAINESKPSHGPRLSDAIKNTK